jgi:hypothetical protein
VSRESAPDLTAHLNLFFTRYPERAVEAVARARELGLANAAAVGVAAWCWEITAQVRALAGERGLQGILMGGTAVQLRISVGEQRLSRDADHLTAASSEQIEALMASLERRFGALPPPWSGPGPAALGVLRSRRRTSRGLSGDLGPTCWPWS